MPGDDAEVTISVAGCARQRRSSRTSAWTTITPTPSRVWQAMGSPQDVEGADYQRLEDAGKLAQIEDRRGHGRERRDRRCTTTLPRQGVSLLRARLVVSSADRSWTRADPLAEIVLLARLQVIDAELGQDPVVACP